MLLLFRNETGFTLFELLLTLLIFSLILLIPLSFFPNTTKTNEALLAANKLKDDIRLAQHIAMSEGTRIDIAFSDQEFLVQNGEEIVERFSYPVPVIMRAKTIGFEEISFLENGHPSKIGTWHVVIEGHTFVYTLQLGKGRVTYRKQ